MADIIQGIRVDLKRRAERRRKNMILAVALVAGTMLYSPLLDQRSGYAQDAAAIAGAGSR
jgi:hypothetical protein